MAHKKAIEALNRMLQGIRGCNQLMGVVVVLLAGDFRLTLPVVPRGTRADEIQACDDMIPEEDGKINVSCIRCDIVPDLITLTEKIYPYIDKAGENCSSLLKERAILTPTNEQANSINNFLLEQLPTEQVRYESVDTVMEDEDVVHYPVEFLHTLNPPGIPPHVLHLKIGTPIILLRDLDPPKLCNGTRLQVKILHKNVIEATIIT
ncbi:uncharacterized protein LOC123264460 [Cotesia glomerata]|uniref:uncharacterized protein LOC123264460 n=1 Tax=Cotesia glomerata TaxID=32391 RepID=UPI001D00FBEC|nr:uncharacterized protein LOC123264460 [Cotesia glomerata]